MTNIQRWAPTSAAMLSAALLLATGTGGAASAENPKDKISPSVEQQGFAISPIPPERLKLAGKDRYMVALGSYLVNGVGDCSGCHTFPRFLRPGGTAPTPANATANLTSQGSNPQYGNPFLDPPDQSLTGQLQANINADPKHNHFLAGGRCFGFFMSRNITPDDSGKAPRPD